MGLLVSPEALTVLGNSAGLAGHGLFGFVILAGLIHILTVLSYGKVYIHYPGPGGEICLLRAAFGAIPSVFTLVCARVTVAVCTSTAVLATAGYVFNEIFLYWFPNMGFSFCLLGTLLALNLLGRRVAATGQFIFVGLAFVGLLFLSVIGFLPWGNAPPAMQDEPAVLMHFPQAGLACILLFVGFDLAVFAGEDQKNSDRAMIAAILAAGLVFAFWGWVSASYVPSGRLTHTSIPHIRAALAVAGETGRVWMGITILAGASAVVNVLLLTVSRMLTIMSSQGLLPRFPALFLLAGAVAVMLASGMAGEPILEVYIKAGMWFWLLHYGVIHAAVYTMTLRSSQRSAIQQITGPRAIPIAGMAAMALGLAGILLLETEGKPFYCVLATLFTSTMIFAACWVSLSKKTNGFIKPQREGKQVKYDSNQSSDCICGEHGILTPEQKQ